MKRYLSYLLFVFLCLEACRPTSASVSSASFASATPQALHPTATSTPSSTPTDIVPTPIPPKPATATATHASTSAPSTSPTWNPAMKTNVAVGMETAHAIVYPTASGTPNSYNLTEMALANREIDIDLLGVYRLFALFMDPRLPEEYTSAQPICCDGLGPVMIAVKDMDRVSAATQRFMSRYLTPRQITVEPTSAHPSATSSPAAFPHGVYSLTIDHGGQSAALPLAGKWTLDLRSPEEAHLQFDGKRVVTSLYRATIAQIEFSDEFGSYA